MLQVFYIQNLNYMKKLDQAPLSQGGIILRNLDQQLDIQNMQNSHIKSIENNHFKKSLILLISLLFLTVILCVASFYIKEARDKAQILIQDKKKLVQNLIQQREQKQTQILQQQKKKKQAQISEQQKKKQAQILQQQKKKQAQILIKQNKKQTKISRKRKKGQPFWLQNYEKQARKMRIACQQESRSKIKINKDENKIMEQKQKHKRFDNISDLSQLYNFSGTGMVVKPTVGLNQNTNQTHYSDFDSLAKGKVTVVMTTAGQSSGLYHALSSFFTTNTYPIQKFIVAKDGGINDFMQQLIKIYKNITWVITIENIGQLATLDVAYQFIETEYLLHLEDDWIYIKPGYIQLALNIFSLYPNATYIPMTPTLDNFGPQVGEKWRKVTFRQDWNAGFSNSPSLHRLKDYTIMPGGFSKISHFASFGRRAGGSQIFISLKYNMIGKYSITTGISFAVHWTFWNNNDDTLGEKFYLANFPDSLSTNKLKKIFLQYDQWVQSQQFYKNMQKKPIEVKNIANIKQLYDFEKDGKIIVKNKPIEQPKEQTLFLEFKNQAAKGDVTLVMTTSGRANYLSASLKSFFNFNTYPIQKIIVVQDGALYEELDRLIKIYKNITWVITTKQIGQLAAIDEAYKFIETQYYFHAPDDWVYLQKGFIEYSLHVLQAEPMASGVWLEGNGKQTQYKVTSYNGELKFHAGFSLNPSLHRLKDYLQWPGGYSNMTGFATFGMGAGSASQMISMKYIMNGYYTVQQHITYVKHIGRDAAQTKYLKDRYRGSEGERRLAKIRTEYDQWIKIQNKKK